MSMESFLSTLQNALGNMDARQKDEILAEFREHFILAKEEGKNEDEICRSLGDPTGIALQFFTEEAEDDKTNKPQNNQNESVAYHENSHKQAYVDIMKRFDRSQVSLIDVDMKRADIKIGGSNTNDVSVSIKGRTLESRYHVKCENGRLSIEEERLNFGFFSIFKRMKHDVKMTLVLPEGCKVDIATHNGAGNTEVYRACGASLKIHNSAGEVNIEGCTYKDINAKSSAGNVTMRGCTSASFEIKSSAGNVRAMDCTGELKAHSSAGNVDIEGFTGDMKLKSSAGDVKVWDTTGNIDAHTSAGTVNIESNQSTGSIKAKSSAGNVNINTCEITRLEADSSAGSVTVRTGTIAEGKINTMAGEACLTAHEITGHVTVKTSMGTAQVFIPQDAVVRIEAKASMGRVQLEVPGDPSANAKLEVFSSMGEAAIHALN